MYIDHLMQALGCEKCSECGRKMKRRETMNMLCYNDGGIYGMVCDSCVVNSKRSAKQKAYRANKEAK